jgi:hypothetical protein
VARRIEPLGNLLRQGLVDHAHVVLGVHAQPLQERQEILVPHVEFLGQFINPDLGH